MEKYKDKVAKHVLNTQVKDHLKNAMTLYDVTSIQKREGKKEREKREGKSRANFKNLPEKRPNRSPKSQSFSP